VKKEKYKTECDLESGGFRERKKRENLVFVCFYFLSSSSSSSSICFCLFVSLSRLRN
jgi:hypothetical protein